MLVFFIWSLSCLCYSLNMTKKLPKHKPILRIVLLSLVAVPVLFILFIIISILLSPLFDSFDRTKFDQMDSQTRTIFNALQSASGGSEMWKYEAKCDAELSGDWPTGKYYCKSEAITTVGAINAVQFLALHEKYYPIIHNSTLLRSTSELDKEKPEEFGSSFVVSSAEEKYELINGGEKCDYVAELAQPYDVTKDYSNSYGSPIAQGGKIILSLTCTATAKGNWYEFSR